MKYGSLILEKKEYVYLKRILNISGYTGDFEIQKSLQRLYEELKDAIIVNESAMPDDVIRFKSKITVSSENGWMRTIQLVTPSEKDTTQDKISILTPMGAALMGYSEGDSIEWDFPTGMKRINIVSVEQAQQHENTEITI